MWSPQEALRTAHPIMMPLPIVDSADGADRHRRAAVWSALLVANATAWALGLVLLGSAVRALS